MENGIVIDIDEEKIKICSSVLNVMKKYIQKEFFSVESGGIMIGKENMSNKNLIINNLTIPMSKDKQRHNRFFRKDKRHIEIFNTLHTESDKTLRYMGEWHTHPEAIPNFSSIDLNNWKKISSESLVEINHYHIIVGFEAIRLWMYSSKQNDTKLLTTIYWKDVKLI